MEMVAVPTKMAAAVAMVVVMVVVGASGMTPRGTNPNNNISTATLITNDATVHSRH